MTDTDTDTVGAEIIERLKSRDLALAAFSAAAATLLGVAFKDSSSTRILLSLPFLGLTLSFLAVYHDNVVQHLHQYVARVKPDSWDASAEYADYRRTFLRWTYCAAQILAFSGFSALALWLNRDACSDPEFQVVWLLGSWTLPINAIALIAMRVFRR